MTQTGIAISTATNYQWGPAVVFDGTTFLVVWEDMRRNGLDDDDIYGARVTPSGEVLDPDGITITAAAYNQSSPDIASDGTNFLVAWTDSRNGGSYSNIYGARVTPTGVVLDPDGIVITAAAYNQNLPAVAFDGTNFFVVWGDERNGVNDDIYGARVTQAGAVLDAQGIAISTAQYGQESPSVAFDGTDFLVVWQHYYISGYHFNIHGARVSQSGTVLDSEDIAISISPDDQRAPVVLSDGASLLVVWESMRSGGCDIFGARVTPQGAVLDTAGMAIALAPNYQSEPVVAFNGTNYLVAWTDRRKEADFDVYGARVTPAGLVLDSAGIAISTAAFDQWSPTVVSNGTDFFVAWTDRRSGNDFSDIYGARVSPAGAVRDPLGIPVSTAANIQTSPAASFDGTDFFVVWMDYRDGIGCSDIYGARVTPQGTVLDPSGLAISRETNDQDHPAVAFDATNYLVAWADHRSGSNYSDIFGARVTPAGVVLDPSGFVVSQATYLQSLPALAFDGLLNFLVVWKDRRSGTNIYGARVTQEGVVLDPDGIPISIAVDVYTVPAIAFDGANFLVVWEDYHGGAESDLYGARVTPAGVVFDSGPVVRQERSQSYPALARGSGNQMFLAYQGWAGTVGGKAYNVDRIWGKMNPVPGVEESRPWPGCSPRPQATIIRGVLYLPPTSDVRHGASVVLLDVSGRKVMNVRPGTNSTKGLAPGVYFLHTGTLSEVRKVLLLR